MADVKIILFFFGCWAAAIVGLSIYQGCFVAKDIIQTFKSKLFHFISTSLVAMLIAGYI
jgi:hypothetical protein